MWGHEAPRISGRGASVLLPSGGGPSMLSAMLLGVALAPAAPGESPAELANWIDARLEASWRAKGLTPPPVVSDDVFLRRAYLDLTGTIPSVAEARDFLDSTTSVKREELILNLLNDTRFPE